MWKPVVHKGIVLGVVLVMLSVHGAPHFVIEDNYLVDPDDLTIYWFQQNPSNPPSARAFHAMSMGDGIRDLFLFGGLNETGILEDLYWYNSSEDSWHVIDALNKPEGRIAAQLVSTRTPNGVMVLFGGKSNSGISNETSLFHTANQSWTNHNPSTSPEGRYYHSMVYGYSEERFNVFGDDRSYVFGGLNATGHVKSDFWVFNHTSVTWEQIPSTGPSARFQTCMEYSPDLSAILLFGGRNITDYFDDTWLYHIGNQTWEEINPVASPEARANAGCVYNRFISNLVLFGGSSSALHADTWIFDPFISNWMKLDIPGPTSRNGTGVAYSGSTNRMILFGGDSGSYTADTWEFYVSQRPIYGTNTSTTSPISNTSVSETTITYNTTVTKVVDVTSTEKVYITSVVTSTRIANMTNTSSPTAVPVHLASTIFSLGIATLILIKKRRQQNH